MSDGWRIAAAVIASWWRREYRRARRDVRTSITEAL
jgi:hypothetical protein